MVLYPQKEKQKRNHGRWYEQTEKSLGGSKEEGIRTVIDDIEEAVKIRN